MDQSNSIIYKKSKIVKISENKFKIFIDDKYKGQTSSLQSGKKFIDECYAKTIKKIKKRLRFQKLLQFLDWRKDFYFMLNNGNLDDLNALKSIFSKEKRVFDLINSKISLITSKSRIPIIIKPIIKKIKNFYDSVDSIYYSLDDVLSDIEINKINRFMKKEMDFVKEHPDKNDLENIYFLNYVKDLSEFEKTRVLDDAENFIAFCIKRGMFPE